LVGIAEAGSDGLFAVDVSGTVYARGLGQAGSVFEIVAQIPSSSPPVDINDSINSASVYVGLINGDVYEISPLEIPSPTPHFVGNVFGGGPTSFSLATWGKLKSHFAH
jgi:hypothetical protein